MRELKSMGKSPGPCGVGAAATALPTRLRALGLGANPLMIKMVGAR